MAVSFTTVIGTTTYGFDWVEQHIEVESGVTEVMAADLKQAIHDAQDGTEGISFPPIATFYNPVILTGTSSTFLNIVLNDQWRIQSLSTSGTLTVGDGNVVNVNNGIDIFVANPLVSMVNNVSASGVLVTGGSGLTGAQATMLEELYRDIGLDASNPKTVTENTPDVSYDETATGITKQVRKSGSVTTITRI